MRMRDNRVTIRSTEWLPLHRKRTKGRPKTPWREELRKLGGKGWTTRLMMMTMMLRDSTGRTNLVLQVPLVTREVEQGAQEDKRRVASYILISSYIQLYH